MRQQTKPFIVEIKQSRKLKADGRKTSIWGSLDLTLSDEPVAHAAPAVEPAVAESADRA